jgi:hypothetical protein
MLLCYFLCHFPAGELEQEFLEAMSDYYYADKTKQACVALCFIVE